MIGVLLCFVLWVKIPIDYFYEDKQPIGISRPVNRADRRKRGK